MRVTIQVCIKQLNPHIPPSIAHGSAPLAHKFNIFCHTHWGEGRVMTPWVCRPNSHLHLSIKSQSLSHFDIPLAVYHNSITSH